MQAYKFDTRISENGMISLPIKPNLFNKEVEIIILPKVFVRKNAGNESTIPDFQQFLLSGPVMSDEQYSNFHQQRQHFNTWRIQ